MNCSCEVCGAVVRNTPLITPAKQKSHHKQQPDFAPRPTGRCSSSSSSSSISSSRSGSSSSSTLYYSLYSILEYAL
jgi:hypothetical protein